MTIRELHPDAAQARIEGKAPDVAARIGRCLAAGARRLQYARMVSALNRLSDRRLAEIGVTRSAIPDYARRLIHGRD